MRSNYTKENINDMTRVARSGKGCALRRDDINNSWPDDALTGMPKSEQSARAQLGLQHSVTFSRPSTPLLTSLA